MVFKDAVDIETNNNEIQIKKLDNGTLNGKLNGFKENDIIKQSIEHKSPECESTVNGDEIKNTPVTVNENSVESNDKLNENVRPVEEVKEEVTKEPSVKESKDDKSNEDKATKVTNVATNEAKPQKAEEALLVELLKEIKNEKIEKKQLKGTSTKIPDFKNIEIEIEKDCQNLRVANKELTFEECLENGRQMMIKFLDNKFEEVIGILDDQADISIIHKLGSAAVHFFDSILTMDKEKMSMALVSMREAAEFADKHRKKTGYISYLITPDYNTFNDVECHAELCYAATMLVSGLLIALEDQSIYGFVNGGLKIRMAHQSFKECAYILKHKTNWESQVARMHFESGTRLGVGSFDLIISFFPTKLAKLLEYIGFNSDRDQAVEELTQAVSLVDGLYYDISSILLSAYYGFLEYFYGLGESDTDFFDKSSHIWLARTPSSSVVKIGLGVREMMVGQPDKAIYYFNECIKGQDFWIQLHYACNWEITWAYVMKSDWSNAAAYAGKLKEECKWSPAMFTYLYAVFLFMEMEHNNKPELAEQISIELKKIPKLKRKLGGKKAFHEKIVLDRSKKFHDNVQNLLLPHLELIYIWNIFHMMAKQPKLLYPMLDDVEDKLNKHTKTTDSGNLDQYCYLTFMKGVIKRHLNQKDEAIQLFEEVINCKKRIKDEIHLLPQSYFELGMIHRGLNNPSEAKRLLKKARDDYSNYLSECMINFRVVNALEMIKKEKQASPLK